VQSPRLLDDRDTTEDESGLLVRRARRYGTVNLGWSSGPWQLGSEIVSASERFNNAANTKQMGGYTLLNLTGSYLINSELKLEARADNVLDKDYVLAYTGNTATSAPYNTAGASLFIGLRWQPQ
jgi:vitamin B12 transporter